MMIGIAAALLACFGYGVSSVLQAYGARRSAAAARDRGATGHVTATGGPTLLSTIHAALTVAFIVGIVLDVVGFVGSAVSARLIPLFLSQTIISANLIVTAVLGITVLGIGLHTRDWIAITVVIVSLFVLGLGAGERGHHDNPDRFIHWVVLAVSVLILLGGIALTRFLGSRSAVMAGLIAGVLFGMLAIGVRILHGVDHFQPWVIVADPAAYVVVIAGIGGFYLHTVALQLGSVNGATAALVVGETVVPGIVGVVFLGDTARPGMGWVVVLGFIGAVAGAVVVAVFGAAGHQASEPEPEPKAEVPDNV
jgi:drug/metabolite transporter (DMT)-like permease